MRRVRLAAASALLLTLVTAAPALGDPADVGHGDEQRSHPTSEAVAAAKADVDGKRRAVAAIRAELLLAEQRLEHSAVVAEQAAEAYNAARWRLEQAELASRQARQDAARARRAVAGQRDAIAALVASSYQQAGQLTALSALVTVDGPEGLLDQYAGFSSASSSMAADYERFAASDALARVFEKKAELAEQRQRRLATSARSAQQQAAGAARRAAAEARAIAAQRRQLIAELAKAQEISVRLAAERQSALQEIARERAQARARREAEVAARAQARAEARAQARARARTARASSEGPKEAAAGSTDAAVPAASAAPAAPAAPVTAGSGSRGASRAIAFAKAQLGEAYRWGAAGPDAWDCSGLLVGAWGAAGVSLPHYSAAQYDAGTPISAADLRPGDLVFWSSTGAPGGIHHVAMYLGDGMIIHAPRTGRPVSIDSLYYWIPPNLFARV